MFEPSLELLAACIDESESVSRQIMRPGDFQIYVATDDLMPIAARQNVRGCTSNTLYGFLRPRLLELGADRGPGRAIHVSESVIGAQTDDEESFLSRFQRTVLHEDAHICCMNPMFEVENPSPEVLQDVAAHLSEPATTNEAKGLLPSHGHGPEFAFALAHLMLRAHHAGWRCQYLLYADMLEAYGYRSAWKMFDMIRGDIENNMHLPMADIMAMGPPDAFRKLHGADLLAWMKEKAAHEAAESARAAAEFEAFAEGFTLKSNGAGGGAVTFSFPSGIEGDTEATELKAVPGTAEAVNS